MSKSIVRGLASLAFPALAAVFALAAAPPARAETFHHCTTFIDTVPATITTAGSYCLRKDLSSSLASGNVISINASNVRLDCNGFRLYGAGAAQPYGAFGIRSLNRHNITVRNCQLSGFSIAVNLAGGSGYVVEDNRSDGARSVGLWINGEFSILRRNHITDVGVGSTGGDTFGILSEGGSTLVEDNLVSLVTGGPSPSGRTFGIYVDGDSPVVRENHVDSIYPGSGTVVGISAQVAARAAIEGNTVMSPAPMTGIGIDAGDDVCARNIVSGYTTPYDQCLDGGGNYGL